jgi:signal transduction histidine kinase
VNLIRRYLTSANVLSWPVILLISLFTLSANLGDTSLNGTEFVAERVALVLGGQGLFFFGILLCDRLFIRRIKSTFRWVALLGAIISLAVLRGVVYAEVAWLLGVSSELNLLPRIFSSMTTLVLLLMIVTLMYGLVIESANQRRQLKSIRKRIVDLETQQMHQRGINAELLQSTLSRLEKSLRPDLLDTPERTLSALRSSIDEVIRPITQTLNSQAQLLNRGVVLSAKPVNWKKFLREMMNSQSLSPAAGVTIFALWISLPMTRVFPIPEALGVVIILSSALLLLTRGLQQIAGCYFSKKRNFFSPLILVLSSLLGVAIASIAMPEWMDGRFEFGLFTAYVLSGFLAIGLRLGLRKSKETSEIISKADADLDWTLARTNEIRLFNDRVISSTLHGKAQAALAAAALRLQQAVRDGSDLENAAELARQEAKRVLSVVTKIEPVIEPLAEALRELTQLWRGVCEISWDETDHVFTLIDNDPVCARLCAEIIVELCTNAIKHGNAKFIDLSVTQVNERIISVTVSNDGDGLKQESGGFGSSLLEQSCLSWDGVDIDGITRVTVKVPFSASSIASPIDCL